MVSKEAANGRLSLKIPGNPKYVSVVRLAISGLASRLRLSYEDVEDIKLAVAEACSRAITHGHGEEVSVECDILPDSLSVSVLDHGSGPQDEEDLGIFLIRSLMDEVICRVDEKLGSRLIMSKRFQAEQQA